MAKLNDIDSVFCNIYWCKTLDLLDGYLHPILYHTFPHFASLVSLLEDQYVYSIMIEMSMFPYTIRKTPPIRGEPESLPDQTAGYRHMSYQRSRLQFQKAVNNYC